MAEEQKRTYSGRGKEMSKGASLFVAVFLIGTVVVLIPIGLAVFWEIFQETADIYLLDAKVFAVIMMAVFAVLMFFLLRTPSQDEVFEIKDGGLYHHQYNGKVVFHAAKDYVELGVRRVRRTRYVYDTVRELIFTENGKKVLINVDRLTQEDADRVARDLNYLKHGQELPKFVQTNPYLMSEEEKARFEAEQAKNASSDADAKVENAKAENAGNNSQMAGNALQKSANGVYAIKAAEMWPADVEAIIGQQEEVVPTTIREEWERAGKDLGRLIVKGLGICCTSSIITVVLVIVLTVLEVNVPDFFVAPFGLIMSLSIIGLIVLSVAWFAVTVYYNDKQAKMASTVAFHNSGLLIKCKDYEAILGSEIKSVSMSNPGAGGSTGEVRTLRIHKGDQQMDYHLGSYQNSKYKPLMENYSLMYSKMQQWCKRHEIEFFDLHN